MSAHREAPQQRVALRWRLNRQRLVLAAYETMQA
jgi:hypothetical protein